MRSYSASSKGWFSRVGEWIDYNQTEFIEVGITIGLIGGLVGGCSYFVKNVGNFRGEKVVISVPIGKGDIFEYFKRDIKWDDDNYRWEIKDKSGQVLVNGKGYANFNTAYFVNKADSLAGELERKVSGTVVEE